VEHNGHANAFVVAAGSGKLTKVYNGSQRSPAIGRTVKVQVAGAGGKLRATRVKTGAARRTAKIRGTVTYANRGTRRFTVSAGGASIAVKARAAKRGGARAASSVDQYLPPVGDQVIVVVSVDTSGDLQAEQVDDLGADDGEIEIEGIVQSVDTTAHKLVISADDEDRAGGTVTVQFPATFDVSGFHQGQEVHLHLLRQADGTFVLKEAEVDEENGADNNGANQNDDNQNGDNQNGGDDKRRV
jgi:hypothetical protein